jgi:hypothetical protein
MEMAFKKYIIGMKKVFIFLCILLLYTHVSLPSFASSPYVLPYPSTMPGGISYKIHLVWEKIMQYWYYGDFGQFDYNLKQSDKYLVQAKTLFEYNQYLLGYQALKKSDIYFQKIIPSLLFAQQHGKSTLDKRKLLSEASQKHIEMLAQIKQETPAQFTWTPEKSNPTSLNIVQAIDNAISIREKDL